MENDYRNNEISPEVTQTENVENNAAGGKKGGKGKIVLIIAAVLLLCAAAFCAGRFFSGDKGNEKTTVQQSSSAASDATQASAKETGTTENTTAGTTENTTGTTAETDVMTVEKLEKLLAANYGYYNLQGENGFVSFSQDGKEVLFGWWYSEGDRPLYFDSIKSSKNGVVEINAYSKAGEWFGTQVERTERVLTLDVSQIEDGKVGVLYEKEWSSYSFAGRTMDEARPPLESFTDN